MVKNKLNKSKKRFELITTLLLSILLISALVLHKYYFNSEMNDYIFLGLLFLSVLPFAGSLLSSFTKLETEFELEFYGSLFSGIFGGLIAGLLISESSKINLVIITSIVIFTLIFGVLTLIKYKHKEVLLKHGG